MEPFWPPRCHLASQSDPRTLKRGCSSLPRGHQCAPKWLSGAPQSRRVPRKCCSRPPRDRQCTQKCCPGPLQSRQGMQKHSPSLHHCEKTADSSFLAALRSKALLEIGVFAFFCVLASVFAIVFACACYVVAFRFRFCCCECLRCPCLFRCLLVRPFLFMLVSVMSVEATIQSIVRKDARNRRSKSLYEVAGLCSAGLSHSSLCSPFLRAWICTGSQ